MRDYSGELKWETKVDAAQCIKVSAKRDKAKFWKTLEISAQLLTEKLCEKILQ